MLVFQKYGDRCVLARSGPASAAKGCKLPLPISRR